MVVGEVVTGVVVDELTADLAHEVGDLGMIAYLLAGSSKLDDHGVVCTP
jgi:hypothetical protein